MKLLYILLLGEHLAFIISIINFFFRDIESFSNSRRSLNFDHLFQSGKTKSPIRRNIFFHIKKRKKEKKIYKRIIGQRKNVRYIIDKPRFDVRFTCPTHLLKRLIFPLPWGKPRFHFSFNNTVLLIVK